MKPQLLTIFLLAFFHPYAQALNVGDITTFIYSGSNQATKEIKNGTREGRFISIRVEKISSPLEGAKIIPMESREEVLYTPAALLMPAESREVVRFIYNGPKDDRERYYRIVWTDQSISEMPQSHAQRKAIATASARIGTLLVVSPAQSHYAHQLEGNVLKNTGNVSFKAIAYGPCLAPKNGENCKENYYIMPGNKRQFSHVDIKNQKSRVAVWQAEKFISVK